MRIVHFVGAGPGAADLLTLRGRDLIGRCDLCVYAGSLISEEILALAPPSARLVDTSDLTLDEIVETIVQAHDRGEEIVRLHSGDLSIWSAIAEQMRRLDRCGVPYDLTPGVPAFAAAAAALRQELTLPNIAQTVILTRTSTRSTPMPLGEELQSLAQTGALLVIHLSIGNLKRVVAELLLWYGADCPTAVVFRATCPDECIIRSTLGTVEPQVAAAGIERTALIFVGRSLDTDSAAFAESYLYSVGRPRA